MQDYGGINHLIVRLARAHWGAASALLQEVGLYPGQELLLMRLWDDDHQSQTALAKSLQLDRSTVTRTVQRLEQQGLIERHASPTDKRAVIVSLTPAGSDLREAVTRSWTQLEEIATDGLSGRQKSEAIRLLRRLDHNLRAFGDGA
ncbi:MarR family winged helix-turn-helix transcriptional regulator [Streptomyces sp. NPDC006649]|uniref:MarR family winged helix-turn-helix transcriptional regulator n=1 Tax=unclassified Streptomyces TaxID=2593676 RepID=UPI002F9188F4